MSHRAKILCCIVGAALAATSVSAQVKQQDFPKRGPAVPPVFRASEDTVIMYPGGPAPAPVTGALDADDSTYNRQFGDCGGVSGTGTAVFYDTISITNTGAGPANFVAFTSDVGSPSMCTGIDTFLTAYDPTFVPGSSGTNCVTSNDDGGLGLCSDISFSVASGGTAVIVVTSFANGSLFSYDVNFTGTTPVELQEFTIE